MKIAACVTGQGVIYTYGLAHRTSAGFSQYEIDPESGARRAPRETVTLGFWTGTGDYLTLQLSLVGVESLGYQIEVALRERLEQIGGAQ